MKNKTKYYYVKDAVENVKKACIAFEKYEKERQRNKRDRKDKEDYDTFARDQLIGAVNDLQDLALADFDSFNYEPDWEEIEKLQNHLEQNELNGVSDDEMLNNLLWFFEVIYIDPSITPYKNENDKIEAERLALGYLNEYRKLAGVYDVLDEDLNLTYWF